MKITIITVCYNSASTIADTLNSVSCQTFKDFEHLVIDGNSTDSTLKVVELHRHSNLTVCSEPDSGIYYAMNKGLRRTSGEVIGFLNSDDYYADATVLEKIAIVFQDAAVEACYGDLDYVTKDNGHIVRYWKSKPYIKGDFARGWCPAHPTFYVRKSTLERLGVFDTSFKFAADVELMMRFLESGAIKSVYIPSVLVRMRLGGLSNQSWVNIFKQNNEIFRALTKNKVAFKFSSFWIHKVLNRVWQYLAARIFRSTILSQINKSKKTKNSDV
ncbi:glycosyltransferase family 2 protein [Polynucleobacter ibericus]|uniref:glycosyltransferase family 2 protein n=1 Tax=Polynucleobacter ibericus TaxID=1819725 RepID=UPI001BFE39F0|nr:glycosyltransferase family 2 protein [Polynucleobacter ibericus]QWE08973.1 glycosyltransferase [Polynucleobacter ibericus]